MAMDLFCEMNKPSSIKEIRETGMLRDFRRASLADHCSCTGKVE